MRQFKCEFFVNNKRTEQVVSARNPVEAKELILAQYSSAKVTWIRYIEVK